MNAGRQIATLVVTFVLAAVLGPTSFGLVAIAMVYVAFIQLVMQQGMGAALVQRPVLEERHLTSGFWMVMGSASILSVLALLGSDWWGELNGEPELGAVVRGLTPLLLLRGLIVVPDAILRREMSFRPLAVRTNLSVIGGGIVGVIAALLGAEVWALVYQQLTTALLEVVIVWLAVDWRPRLSVSRAAIDDLLGFSLKSAVASIGNVVNNRADALVIGLVLGPTAVGLYRFAARLVDTVIESIFGSLRAVSLPELARLQHQHEALRSRVIQLQRLASASAFVPLAALAAAGPAIIEVLGDEWAPATAAIAILAIAGAGRVVGQQTGPLLQALGRPGNLAALTWIAAIISATVLAIGTTAVRGDSLETQVTGLAILTAVLHAVIFLAISTGVMRHVTGIGLRELLACLVPGAVAGIAGFGAGRVVDQVVNGLDVAVLRAAITGGTAFFVALSVLSLLEPEVRNRLRAAMARLPGAPPTVSGSTTTARY